MDEEGEKSGQGDKLLPDGCTFMFFAILIVLLVGGNCITPGTRCEKFFSYLSPG